MKLSLVRLAFVSFPRLLKKYRSWSCQVDQVTVATLAPYATDREVKLLVAARVDLEYPPKVANGGFVVVPRKPRESAERAIEHLGNLLAVATVERRAISSATPCIVLHPHDEEAKTFLQGCKGWLRESEPPMAFRIKTALDMGKLATGLTDRLEGVALLAESLSHEHAVGKFHEFVRLFERAFAVGGKKLPAPLGKFLESSRFGYTQSEVDRWIKLRDPATHADQRNEIVFEADVRTVISRMEQAAFDVLLNKAEWRKDSWTRRTFYPLPCGIGSQPHEKPNIVVTQGTSPQLTGQLLDPFGAFPVDLGGTLTKLPNPEWWAGESSDGKESQPQPFTVTRDAERERRVEDVIAGFEPYLEAFDKKPPFDREGQLDSHASTIALRRAAGSVARALERDDFLESLRKTLIKWGMNGRGAKLVPPREFAEALRSRGAEIAAIEAFSISDPQLRVQEVAGRIWWIIESLGITTSKARLVACTKALHHLLPDLVVPMDRRWTRRFFQWYTPQFQYGEERVFRYAFERFARIGREVRPERFVGSGWRTCPAKLIDNAIIGYCVEKDLPLPS